MNVILMPEAEETLYEVSYFLDNMNTEGSGSRWLHRIYIFLTSYAKANTQYALCLRKVFADELYSCIHYNGWTFAFKIIDDEFIVYQVVRGNVMQ